MSKSPRVPESSTSLATIAVHGGEPRQHPSAALTTPIACTATYTFRDTAELRDHFEGRSDREEYGRYGNPTLRVAEHKVAALDGAEDSVLFSSGMAAITTTLLAMLRSGHHVVLTSDCYRRTRQFIGHILPRFGVESTLVPPDDVAAIEAAIRPNTRLLVAESPTNPYLRVLDLEALRPVRARHPALKILVDATFASPINQRPLAQGADLVFQSCTKFLSGHNDILGGAVSGPGPLVQAIRDFRGILGGILDAHSAYLLIRGLKTLALRVERQNATALAVATALQADPRVTRVWYPGLPTHPDFEVAQRHMSGFGGVVSFTVRGDEAATARFIDACTIPAIAPSLGGVESLIEQPALMSYYELSTEERLAVGISDNLVRLSLGLEDVGDLIVDLTSALAALTPP